MSKRAKPDEVEVDGLRETFNTKRKTVYDELFSLVSWCRAIGTQYEKDFQKEQAKKIIPKRYVHYTQKYLESRPSEADQLLIDIRKSLCFFDSIGFQRSAHQRKFHESMLAACIRHIYKDEFSDNFIKILEENGWEEARQEVMICCPRRFGKTFATGMFVAAYLYVIPNVEICIFSPSRRQSEKMLELVRTFLIKLPGAKERITKYNKERMWLKGGGGAEDLRKVSSYPSKVSTLKGVGGDLIVCEEAAAMDTAVFYEVVVPLLELDRTALICISTILDSFNFYSKLMELKDENGDNFFVIHNFVMACQNCIDEGTPENCTHMFNSLPPWQSARKHKKIRAMMSDQQELLQRETMGIQSDAFGSAFKTKAIRALLRRAKTPISTTMPARHVFMAIDPSGGGESHFALVTCFYEGGAMFVCGLESIPAKNPSDYENGLRTHSRMLRQDPKFANSLLVVCPEANLGFESEHIAKIMRTTPCTIIMQECSNGMAGMKTTHKSKEVMCNLLSEKLDQDAVHIYDKLVCSTGNSQKAVDDLLTQLQNYSIIYAVPDKMAHFQSSKKTYSGKHQGNDDMAVMIQFNILAFTRFFKNTTYNVYW